MKGQNFIILYWKGIVVIALILFSIHVYTHDSNAFEESHNKLNLVSMVILFSSPISETTDGSVKIIFSGQNISGVNTISHFGAFEASKYISPHPENMLLSINELRSDSNRYQTKSFENIMFPTQSDSLLIFDKVNTGYLYPNLGQDAKLCVVSEVSYNGGAFIPLFFDAKKSFGKCITMHLSM